MASNEEEDEEEGVEEEADADGAADAIVQQQAMNCCRTSIGYAGSI